MSNYTKKYDLDIMNACSMNVVQILHSPCCHYHVTFQHQLRHFTAIHKSSPVTSLDSKVSFICTLQNLAESSKSPGYLPTLLWALWIQTFFFYHILFVAYYIVRKYAI